MLTSLCFSSPRVLQVLTPRMKKRREVVIEIGRQVVQIQVQLVFLPSTQDIREIKQQRR